MQTSYIQWCLFTTFIYKHLHVQAAHPEACVVGPGVRKCVPYLPHSCCLWQLSFPHPGGHAATAQIVYAECLNCLGSTPGSWLSSRAKISFHAARVHLTPPCLRRNTAWTPWHLCSAAGTGDSIPSGCRNPSPCNSDKCTSEGELHLVQGSGVPPAKTVHQTSSLGTCSGFFTITCPSGQAPDRGFPWKTNQSFFLFNQT